MGCHGEPEEGMGRVSFGETGTRPGGPIESFPTIAAAALLTDGA